jgi:hypothetical protein
MCQRVRAGWLLTLVFTVYLCLDFSSPFVPGALVFDADQNRTPDRVWGGPGIGALCAVCKRPVTNANLELEMEFAREVDFPGLDTFHVHVRCLAAWEFERRQADGLVARPPD